MDARVKPGHDGESARFRQRPASLLQGSPGDAAVAQRQSNRFVSDRLTVRIRPAAPAILRLLCGARALPLRIIIVLPGSTKRLVLAGLDPAIHPLGQNFLAKKMDPRVKPAGDGVGATATSASRRA